LLRTVLLRSSHRACRRSFHGQRRRVLSPDRHEPRPGSCSCPRRDLDGDLALSPRSPTTCRPSRRADCVDGELRPQNDTAASNVSEAGWRTALDVLSPVPQSLRGRRTALGARGQQQDDPAQCKMTLHNLLVSEHSKRR
jgi:hypothetical protein